MEAYPWYAVVEGNQPLRQGDFVKECPIIIPPDVITAGKVPADVEAYDITIMTQSCDLEHGKVNLVLVCPTVPLSELAEDNPFLQEKRGRKALKDGNLPGYHLLARCNIPDFQTKDHLVVDFHNVYGVPLDYLLDLARQRGKRLRLLPPYREHMSQAFARFFMRVGLPVEIPDFD